MEFWKQKTLIARKAENDAERNKASRPSGFQNKPSNIQPSQLDDLKKAALEGSMGS